VRAAVFIGVLVVAGVGWLVVFGTRPDPEAKTTQSGLSKRVMARTGFVPPGAPIKAPPHPEPRKGAAAVGFDRLAGFDYEQESGTLPVEITALDGRLVEVVGVMYFSVPDPERVTEFYMMPDHSVCCFGIPRLNQIIEVHLPEGEATEYLLDYYLVRGRLEVGPFYDEAGLPLCLYRIEDAEVEFLN